MSKLVIPKFEKALDIGCGQHCLPGAVGIDHLPYPGVQFVHNLNKGPWPIKDSEFDYIRCQHVIEHIEDLFVLAREVYRVAKPGARIDFVTPHYSSMASWGDPTHRWHFALDSIPHLFRHTLGKEGDKFKVLKNKIKFTGSIWEVPGMLWYLYSPRKYEKHFAWVFPANEIHTSIQFFK